jgi:hypothetical protein
MSGVKGRSGRKPKYMELNTQELLHMSEATIRQYLKDTTIPLQNRALVAAGLYQKAIKTQNETAIRLLHDTDIAILSKYDKPLELTRLDALAGNGGGNGGNGIGGGGVG